MHKFEKNRSKHLEQAWTDKEEFFAKTLNHMAGFRLAVYKKRGWDSILKEPFANESNEATNIGCDVGSNQRA